MPTAAVKEGKLKDTCGIPVHPLVQNGSQVVWRAGPLEVWVSDWSDGVQRVSLYVRTDELAAMEEWHGWLEGFCKGRVELNFGVGPALDQALVELVDVIAEVRRACGMVQLELEGLEEGDE